MHPIHVPHHHPEVQMSAVRLSPSEEAGERSAALGMSPQRNHQPPAGLLLGWRRFLDTAQPSGPSNRIIAPSARRAAPRRSVA